MLVLFMSFLLPIILIYFFHKTKKKTSPPGPPPLPLIGNLHQLATAGDLHVYLWELSKKYGPIIHMKLGSTPLVVVSTAKLAKEVLKTQDLALLMNIFIAATDTSSAAIVWTMTALIKAPSIMKKVQEEIRNSVGEKSKVDEDDLPKLPYLKSVIKETFRLYPTAPLLVPRETIERCIVDGYEIQPKTVVYVNAWAASRDPEYWENPDEFKPERFLNSSFDIRGQDFGVTPFGSGRRMCPGMSMGLLNVEIILANLLYHFDWELPAGVGVEDVDTDAMPGLVVLKKNALVLVPTKYDYYY